MKFWNKQHKVRARCWTLVQLPAEPDAPHFGGLVGAVPYHGWTSRGPIINSAAMWVNTSTGWTHHAISRTGGNTTTYVNGVMQVTNKTSFTELFTMLQHHQGNGKFYMTIMRKEIWFENAADATWFILTHLGN